MKLILKVITDEMTGNTELTKALNENFEALNESAHKREIQIFDRLTSMDNKIASLGTEVSSVKTTTAQLSKDLTSLIKYFEVEAGVQILTD